MIENTCAQFILSDTNLTKLSSAISSRYQLGCICFALEHVDHAPGHHEAATCVLLLKTQAQNPQGMSILAAY